VPLLLVLLGLAAVGAGRSRKPRATADAHREPASDADSEGTMRRAGPG
jgi:hypothetical protein